MTEWFKFLLGGAIIGFGAGSLTLFLFVRRLLGSEHEFTRKDGLFDHAAFLLVFAAMAASELLDCVTAKSPGLLGRNLIGFTLFSLMVWLQARRLYAATRPASPAQTR